MAACAQKDTLASDSSPSSNIAEDDNKTKSSQPALSVAGISPTSSEEGSDISSRHTDDSSNQSSQAPANSPIHPGNGSGAGTNNTNNDSTPPQQKPPPAAGDLQVPTKEPTPPVEPPISPQPNEPIEPPPPAFDVNAWIDFAKNYGQSIGLGLDSTATFCWDDPITANSSCIYLERDIKDTLDWYKSSGFTVFWAWSENLGTGNYLIYIGYA